MSKCSRSTYTGDVQRSDYNCKLSVVAVLDRSLSVLLVTCLEIFQLAIQAAIARIDELDPYYHKAEVRVVFVL